jgi:hypothetical protein
MELIIMLASLATLVATLIAEPGTRLRESRRGSLELGHAGFRVN